MVSITEEPFEIFEKLDVRISLKVRAASFEIEKRQLLDQGFVITGKVMTAKDSAHALNKIKRSRLINTQKPTVWRILTSELFN